jgi:phage-related baseplate assembly protein
VAVQKNAKVATPFEVLPVASPAGAYRYQWVADQAGVSVASAQYLVPVGSDVYVLSLSVNLPLAASYSPILTSIVESLSIASASVTSAPPAGSLEAAFANVRF